MVRTYVVIRTPQASGNIINAASASSAAVQTAINSAASGDTVLLPTGASATWGANAVSIPSTKGITLNLNGSTITRSGSAGTSATCFTLNTNSSVRSRVTNGIFVSGGGSGALERYMTINTSSSGNDPYYRIDNVDFLNPDGDLGAPILIQGSGYGLFDHCTLEGNGNTEIVQHQAYGPGDDTGWENVVTPGSYDAAYFEDCDIINYASPSYFGGKTLGTYGARVVYRRNNITRVAIDAHGNVHPTCRWWEVYDNTFGLTNGDDVSDWMIFRGGTGVILDNVANGSNNGGGNITFYEDSDDGNTGAWPQLYQVGMGRLVSGSHTRQPAYAFRNTGSDGFSYNFPTDEDTVVQLNRDVFTDTSANGVRVGTLATMNALVGMTQYQAFWATDHGSTGGLYVYNGSAWALYFVKAVYPHPLNT